MSNLRITRESLLDGTIRALQQAHIATYGDTPHRSEAEMAALLDEILAARAPDQDVWVFGYGSLIWNPAFEFEEKRAAMLHGWHRRFCLKLLMGRGSPETPGIMLALDRGGACKGLAYRIAREKVRDELFVLWQREMFGGAYNARWVTLRDRGGSRLRAVTFVINRAHPRYLRELSVAQTAALIHGGCGQLGTCREYLENTVTHLAALGFKDQGLTRILRALPNGG